MKAKKKTTKVVNSSKKKMLARMEKDFGEGVASFGDDDDNIPER
jgi:hypothetical protein